MEEQTMVQRISKKRRIPMDRVLLDSEKYPLWMIECDCKGCVKCRQEGKIGGVRTKTAKR